MKRSFLHRSIAGFGAAVVLILLEGVWSYRSTQQLLDAAQWVEHTHEVLQSLDSLAVTLRNLESSSRGYVITGSSDYIGKQEETYHNALAIPVTLRSLTFDNPRQQRRLDDLDRRVAEKLAFIRKVVEARREEGLEAGRALLASGEGKLNMDAVDGILQAIRDEEHALLQKRLQTRVTAAQATVRWIAAGTALTLCLISAVGYLLIREATKRHRTSAALRRQTSVLESILRCMSDGVVVADMDSRFMQFNPAAERILGVGSSDVSPADWARTYNTFHSDQVTPYPAEELPLARAIRGHNVDDAELFIRHPDRPEGTWISVGASPLLDGADNQIGGLVVIRDTTKQKLAETQVRQYAANLEHANRELSSQAQALARANKELEQFAYIASHDLQEPLRMVASFCQLLKKRYHGQFDEKADRWLDFATDGAARMHVLIQDLLQYSRAGRNDKIMESVDLNSVLSDVLTDLALAIHDAGAEVHVDRMPSITADRTQLHQLFQNLISNALKFRGPEPPVIHVSCRHEGDFLKCTISDNGIGIEPQHFDRIFKIFHRLHSKQDYPGTGIGLAVCSKIVERHGGQIWVESELNRGTKFHFTVQLADGDRSALKELELQLT